MVADALSHMYSNDSPGTVCARSEYTIHDIVNNDMTALVNESLAIPVFAGIQARVATRHSTRVRWAPCPADADWVEPGVVIPHGMLVDGHSILHGERKEGRSMDTLEAIDSAGGNHSESGNNKDNAQSIAISDDCPNMEKGLQPNMAQVPDTLLVSVSSRSTLGLDLLNRLRGKYHQDPAFHTIIQ